MLNYILQQAQRFERRHGKNPNVVYMNEEHYLALSEELPELFRDTPKLPLGFRIAIMSKDSLTHPQVALIEERKEQNIHPRVALSQSVSH